MSIPAETALKVYLQQVETALKRGDATEHTYRPFFKTLLESLHPAVTAINEPKRSAAGAPDYLVARKSGNLTLGYVEAKDIGVSLDDAADSEQLARYRRSLPNLLLTDYLEFRRFVEGEKKPRLVARLARVLPSGKLAIDPADHPAALALLRDFATSEPAGIDHPEELARRMARLAHLIRDLIIDEFREDRASPLLQGWFKAFADTLLPNITREDFADMFAQTLAYGLFSARIMGGGVAKFDRAEAQRHIPKTNPFLAQFFYLITGPDLDDEPFAPFVGDLVQALARTDVYELLKNFGKKTGRADPMLHFYETFLGAYDPRLKELRGVFYTPEPVVGWLVRSVDSLLKSPAHFNLPDGLADASRAGPEPDSPHRVLVLDPATGTATFLYAIIRFVRQKFIDADDAGQWPGYVERDLLPRLFGFELLMAPYAVAHFKLGLELAARDMEDLWRDAWSYEFHNKERLHIYLTNTLDDLGHKSQALLGPAAQEITQESAAAAAIKQKLPVLVVIGNPPYSGHSANSGEWIASLVRDYYTVDGAPLGERNSKWLQDDYVKFIRWGQWRIEQSGGGILAFITNHGYLDNPTFRGMRQQLMGAFDEIWLVDLHGNADKGETPPDGEKDDNVFDIKRGVALAIFVKLPGGQSGTKKKPAKVRHAHLWGKRAYKYAWLDAHDVTNTKWTVLKPQSPSYYFFPQDLRLKTEYEAGWKLSDVMPVTLLGPNSHRDDFAIAFDEETAKRRFTDFFNPKITDADLRTRYDLKDTRDWQLSDARKTTADQKSIVRCLYRPFDSRVMLYGSYAFDYHRPEINDTILAGSLALISTRQTKEAFAVFVTDKPAGQHKLATPYDGSYLSPLYIYPRPKQPDEFIVEEGDGPVANLAPKFIAEFAAKLKLKFIPFGAGDRRKTFGPEDVLHYAYAVFHSPAYRTRYAEFLRIDFPRLPLTADAKLFRTLADHGKDLVDLHLLKTTGALKIGYPAKGDNAVMEVTYEPPKSGQPGRVRINSEQWFEGVPPEVWAFHVGGYQVAEKWLKDRRTRQLTIDERRDYPRILAALAETLRLQAGIDEAIAAAGGWPAAFAQP